MQTEDLKPKVEETIKHLKIKVKKLFDEKVGSCFVFISMLVRQHAS